MCLLFVDDIDRLRYNKDERILNKGVEKLSVEITDKNKWFQSEEWGWSKLDFSLSINSTPTFCSAFRMFLILRLSGKPSLVRSANHSVGNPASPYSISWYHGCFQVISWVFQYFSLNWGHHIISFCFWLFYQNAQSNGSLQLLINETVNWLTPEHT